MPSPPNMLGGWPLTWSGLHHWQIGPFQIVERIVKVALRDINSLHKLHLVQSEPGSFHILLQLEKLFKQFLILVSVILRLLCLPLQKSPPDNAVLLFPSSFTHSSGIHPASIPYLLTPPLSRITACTWFYYSLTE